jgi:gliding motility-associated-like protein
VNPLPVVDAGLYAAVCVDGANVSLVGSPVGGTFNGIGVTGSAFNPTSGTQTITYSYTNANGCSNTDFATITVNALPVVSAGIYLPVCADAAPVNMVGTPPGGTFTGTGVAGTLFNPASGTQTITYTFISPQNCSNSSTSTIQVNDLPTINAGADSTVCAGSTVTLNGGGGMIYSWDNGGVNGQAFTPSTGSTIFTVTGTDANGCVNTDNVTINTLAYPSADAIADATSGNPGLVVNFDNYSINSTTYNWDFGNGASTTVVDLSSQTMTYSSVGSYLMLLTVSNGVCSDTAMIAIDILPYPIPDVHVPNVFTPNDDNANDEFYISTQNASAIEVIILNRWGNVVHEINTLDGVWDGEVNGKQAEDGVYFFKYNVTGMNGEEIIGHGNITLIR